MTKITKEEFDLLYDENVTKKAYDAIIVKIDKRFMEICLKLLKLTPSKAWYDYGNCNYDAEGSTGFFDPKEFKEEIIVGGEWFEMPAGFDNSFPTRWLWEDFKTEAKEITAKYLAAEKIEKEKAAEKKQNLSKKKKALVESIKGKLTAAELKIVEFK